MTAVQNISRIISIAGTAPAVIISNRSYLLCDIVASSSSLRCSSPPPPTVNSAAWLQPPSPWQSSRLPVSRRPISVHLVYIYSVLSWSLSLDFRAAWSGNALKWEIKLSIYVYVISLHLEHHLISAERFICCKWELLFNWSFNLGVSGNLSCETLYNFHWAVSPACRGRNESLNESNSALFFYIFCPR